MPLEMAAACQLVDNNPDRTWCSKKKRKRKHECWSLRGEFLYFARFYIDFPFFWRELYFLGKRRNEREVDCQHGVKDNPLVFSVKCDPSAVVTSFFSFSFLVVRCVDFERFCIFARPQSALQCIEEAGVARALSLQQQQQQPPPAQVNIKIYLYTEGGVKVKKHSVSGLPPERSYLSWASVSRSALSFRSNSESLTWSHLFCLHLVPPLSLSILSLSLSLLVVVVESSACVLYLTGSLSLFLFDCRQRVVVGQSAIANL